MQEVLAAYEWMDVASDPGEHPTHSVLSARTCTGSMLILGLGQQFNRWPSPKISMILAGART
jgi:hypothetical protein